MPTRTHTPTPAFRGFDDWIEVFAAGEHTDAAGNTRVWSETDLDDLVRNHSEADAAPLVIGHPKTDDPAWGWTAALKREGGRLLAKFRDVAREFADGVEAGRWRKRSIRVVHTPAGWRLVHVGFLGAAPPAVSGLAPLHYSAPEGELHDYTADWYTPSVMARFTRRLREFLVEHFGADAADRVVPEYEIDELKSHADAALQAETKTDRPEPAFAASGGNNPSGGDHPMPDQDAIERARQEARAAAEAEFSARQNDLEQQLRNERGQRLRSELDAAVAAAIGRGVRPALLEGAPEFMQALADTAEFEFSAGGQPQKTAPLAWFRGLLDQLPPEVPLGEHGHQEPGTAAASYAAPPGYAVDAGALELHRKALDYQRAHPDTDYLTAVRAVNNE